MAPSPQFDLIVIGGGVNGTGIARDAALRGLSVLMLEKKDVASGASGANSGMIHGGIRYLRYERRVTELACIDSGYIQKIVPHLLFRIPFLYPLSAEDVAHPTWMERYLAYGAQVYFGAYDLYQPYKRGLPSVSLSRKEALELEPALDPNMLGALSLDEWGIDPWRLCALNAQSAQAEGAVIRTYAEVKGFARGEGGAVEGVFVEDARTGECTTYWGKIVVNVAGAWAEKVAAMAGATVKMRPGKGVHLVLDRRVSNYGVISKAIDGRQVFVLPYGQHSLIGTTDDDYFGDPDALAANEDEVKYLLDAARSALPGLGEVRVVRTWVGLRTSPHEHGRMEDELSREHRVYDHSREGAANLFSLIGGKLASYRAQSEELTTLACGRLGLERECRTHLVALPGGESFPNVADLARDSGMAEATVARMAYRHGKNAERICEMAKRQPELSALLCLCEQTTYAEALYCMREENVRRLSDLSRRCGIGVGPCDGSRCALAAAALFGRERQLSSADCRRELSDFISEKLKASTPALAQDQLPQAELLRSNVFGVGDLHAEEPLLE
jgi:glycerol-3-phosphate dehydrogenase